MIVARCLSMSEYTIDGTASTLKARDYKGGAVDIVIEKPKRKYIVRRLTPTECARLQGFPMVAEVDIENMTNDELAMLCMAEGFIKVDPSTGKVYGNRGPGGFVQSDYHELTGTIINGYKSFKLHFAGFAKPVRAHRIVWMSVHGSIPEGLVVDHINCDKLDNRIENLQLLSPEQNSTKAKADGRYPTGDNCKSSRSKENDRKIISYLYWHTDTTCKRLASMFGLSPSRVHQIIHEYEWTDGADGSDSAKYKLWGNGIALPCAEDVIGRVAKALREEQQ